MISVAILDSERDEAKLLETELRRLTARETEEQITFLPLGKGQLQDQLGELSYLNMALIDVTVPGGLEAARQLRERYPQLQLLVIATAQISPVRYLTPAIRPSALLLRPYAQEHFHRTVKDFFLLAIRPLQEKGELFFWTRTRDGSERIPYRSILYFEARDKRIFVRTRALEYGTNTTMEKLLEEIPSNFVRCHRSYILNRDCIERVSLPEGMVYLVHSMRVPIARSYRAAWKEYISGNQQAAL